MKTLEQIQQENRERIILANNPTAKSYEEAVKLMIEDKGWCYKEEIRESNVNAVAKNFSIKLNHVLIALNITKEVGFDSKGYFIDPVGFEYTTYAWNLTKETLQDQKESVQREVNKLLGD